MAATDKSPDRRTALGGFHPAVATWFASRFPEGPTPAQELGWAAIAAGDDTLIAAPTGSGKTLAAFLVALDRCLRAPAHEPATTVLYISPLRALTVDVAANLTGPLEEIRELAAAGGTALPAVTVAVRNGDTPPSVRQAMLRRHPDIVVTTPESLYLLLTSRRGRELLGDVEAVIIDEIHALARDKRGSHLSLSLERLDRLVRTTHAGRARPVRIGLSATQRPIETVARLLVGSGPERREPDGSASCAIVDVGHQRALECSIVLPEDELGAVATNEQFDEVIVSLAEEIAAHRTTLVFVNTRRMAERVAHLLSELTGDAVAAHHGSLSAERRLDVERQLRAGTLSCVVATASLELGIDIGPIDLVCQLGSPRAIATFLQRIGRAEHHRGGVSRGRLYPMSRDELVECVALLAAVRVGTLDIVHPPHAPLDILAQQLVAECAAAGDEGITETDLAALVRRATPFEDLGDESLEAVIDLVAEGVTTGRGQRGAHLHRDQVNGILRARRGAGLTALTSGGAIPELADYRVILEPEEVVVGTVHEDFAVEAMAGDVFLLGSHSWLVRRVEQGAVRVLDAQGLPPTIPFWLGEAPGRTTELSEAVSTLRALVVVALEDGEIATAIEAVIAFAGVDRRAASEVVAYLAAAYAQLGTLPTVDELVFERFFDETGGMQLVVHSPFGARVNRGLGLALRKRFCRSFDFELQAAASDDAIVLSLGPQHAFPLEEVPRYLAPATVRDTLIQAMLPTPIFTARWRWNLGRSLVSPRFRGARHLPPAIQRMEADDLMAAIFPMLAACQENVSGPIEVPDHPIVNQTVEDCLTEAMDIDALTSLVAKVRSGEIRARCVDTAEPSLLAHEILNGRPYTFLDDAPLEERRTRSIALRRGIPLEAHDLTRLDADIVAEVVEQVRPEPRDLEELHDLLRTVYLAEPLAPYSGLFSELVAARRASAVVIDEEIRWCATERRPALEALYPLATFVPDHPVPERLRAAATSEPVEVLATVVRGLLEFRGPTRVLELATATCTSEMQVTQALAVCERAGAVLACGAGTYGARRVVQRIRYLQTDRARRAVPAASARDLVRFLLEWQHVAPDHKLRGTDGLLAVIDQLSGFEVAAGGLETEVLAPRLAQYQPTMLDELCASGLVVWGRLVARLGEEDEPRRGAQTPSRATPLTLCRREDLGALLRVTRRGLEPAWPRAGAARDILEALSESGALFFAELGEATGRLPNEVAEGLWEAVARGLVTADGFAAVRALLAGRYRNPSSSAARHHSGPARRIANRARPVVALGGRWSLLRPNLTAEKELQRGVDTEEAAELAALRLLDRYGVVFRELVQRDPLAAGFAEIRYALRRLEARGVARGGRFVAGFSGEQFALPEAAQALREISGREPNGTRVELSSSDPLNLSGILHGTARIASGANRRVVYLDGVLVESDRAGADSTGAPADALR